MGKTLAIAVILAGAGVIFTGIDMMRHAQAGMGLLFFIGGCSITFFGAAGFFSAKIREGRRCRNGNS